MVLLASYFWGVLLSGSCNSPHTRNIPGATPKAKGKRKRGALTGPGTPASTATSGAPVTPGADPNERPPKRTSKKQRSEQDERASKLRATLDSTMKKSKLVQSLIKSKQPGWERMQGKENLGRLETAISTVSVTDLDIISYLSNEAVFKRGKAPDEITSVLDKFLLMQKDVEALQTITDELNQYYAILTKDKKKTEKPDKKNGASTQGP